MTQSSLRATLRNDTSDAHRRVDALVGGGFSDESAYRRYLRGMQRFLAASRPALGPAWPLAPLQALLLEDMRTLGIQPARDVPADPNPSGDEAARLGIAYVVGGASVGARRLLREAVALGFGPQRSAAFLHGFAHSPMWACVLSRLDAARLDADQTDRCSAAAVAAFATAEAAFGCPETIHD